MAKNKDCVFCRIIAGEISAEKIYEDDNFVVINDAHPASPGHCLIIPKKHYATSLDLPSTLGTELLDIAKKQALRLIKEGKADGFKFVVNNLEAGGQLVPHFHFHVIPEKKDAKAKHV